MNNHRNSALGTLAVLSIVVLPVRAEVAGLRSVQSTNANLLYQWSFEGDAAQRLLDTAGGSDVRDLEAIAGLDGGDAANVGFMPGLDASTTALEPERLDQFSGAALRSLVDDPNTADDDLFLPQKMTVEMLFRADSASLSCDDDLVCLAYGPNTRQWPLRRGYYLVQDGRAGSTTSGDIVALIGGSFSNNARTIIDGNALEVGDWYYYALTLEATNPAVDVIPDTVFPLDPDGSDTILNAYIANVSNGDATLTQVLTNEVVTGGWSGPRNSVAFGRIGMGMFSEQPQQFWDGALDEVAFYDEVLSGATLQTHLDALQVVPGPSTAMLLPALVLLWLRDRAYRPLGLASPRQPTNGGPDALKARRGQ